MMKKCPQCEQLYSAEISFCPADGTKLQAMVAKGQFSPGQQLSDRYKIEEQIDLSGRWFVYYGREMTTDRRVAIRIYQKTIEKHQVYFDFQKRIEAIKRVSSPGIVQILDHGLTEDHMFYVVTEYVRGKDLRTILRDVKGLSRSFATSIAIQILEVLSVAHRQRVFHRYLQPSKIILVESGKQQSFVKILGFDELETNREIDTTIEKEAALSLRKSNDYTAPEVVLGDTLDARCDVFSVGIIVYEIITGVLPFPPGISRREKSTPAVPPMRRVKPSLKISRKLEKSILRAIVWDKRKRFSNTKAFSKAIEASNKKISLAQVSLLVLGIFLLSVLASWRATIFQYIEEFQLYLSTPEQATEKPEPVPEEQDREKIAWQNFVEQSQKVKNFSPKKVDISTMQLIPAGKTLIGSAFGASDERPVRIVPIAAFYIDRTEVTNGEYLAFIEVTGYHAPKYWNNNRYPDGQENHPVVQVSWYDAATYASWAGKRLPTEVEWERAARGSSNTNPIQEKNPWPWGDVFFSDYCNVSSGHLMPVGQYPKGQSVHGVFDMSGNVWEWTSSWYDVTTKRDRVIRGGSFLSEPFQARTTYRDGFFPISFRRDIGFRCVKDAK